MLDLSIAWIDLEERTVPTNKRAIYTELLPSTPSTPEMREQMLHVAQERGVSLAEVQREAFSLFLSANYSKAIVENSDDIVKGTT